MIFVTCALLDAKEEPFFASELRIMKTMWYETAILVSCRWLSGNCGALTLQFDPVQGGFGGGREKP